MRLVLLLNKIYYTITTEGCYNSTYVSKSDTIYDSSYVYNSANCSNCKNIVIVMNVVEVSVCWHHKEVVIVLFQLG